MAVFTSEDYLANAFWVRKMKTAFHFFDVNKNDILSVEDFELMADRFGEKCPERADEIKAAIITLFLDSTGSREKTLTIDEWVETRANVVVKPGAREKFRDVIVRKFDIVDTDQNGTISRKEFRDYFECLGITDTKIADASFDCLDTNHDGVISRDEFGNAGEEFRFGFSDENHPSKFFYGPLI